MGRRKEVKRCVKCGKKLPKKNITMYCNICFRTSPKRLEYQRKIARKYYKENKEKILRYQKEYKQRPRVKAIRKEYMKRWYQKNKDKINKYYKKYYQNNKKKKNGKRSINKNKS